MDTTFESGKGIDLGDLMQSIYDDMEREASTRKEEELGRESENAGEIGLYPELMERIKKLEHRETINIRMTLAKDGGGIENPEKKAVKLDVEAVLKRQEAREKALKEHREKQERAWETMCATAVIGSMGLLLMGICKLAAIIAGIIPM